MVAQLVCTDKHEAVGLCTMMPDVQRESRNGGCEVFDVVYVGTLRWVTWVGGKQSHVTADVDIPSTRSRVCLSVVIHHPIAVTRVAPSSNQ